MTDHTLEELLIARMAKEFSGERIAVGATILSDISARLAKALYVPDAMLLTHSRAAADPILTPKGQNEEWSLTPSAASFLGWPEMFDMIAQGLLQIWIGTVQIDKHGNSNISVVGSWDKPAVQLVGARGVPDDLWGCERLCYHLRKHNRRAFVDRVDFVCGLGYGPERDRLKLDRGWPGTVVSDLGVFGWDEALGHMKIETLHPGVTFAEVQAKTGFAWPAKYGESFPETAAPTEEELYWIREKLDPRGLRRLESTEATAELLKAVWSEEAARIANSNGASA